MKSINKIILCSTSTGSEDIGLAELDDICRDRGYKLGPDGYCIWHYIIRRDGQVQSGRDEELEGFHINRYDRDAILVALVGSKDNFTKEQMLSLDEIIPYLLEQYPDVQIKDASSVAINLQGIY